MSAKPFPGPYALSTRSHLLLLVAFLLLPVIAFSGLTVQRFAEGERARYRGDVLDRARHFSASVDRELAGFERALLVLSTSQALEDRDYARFYRRASETKRLLGSEIVLKDPSGQQLVNTRLPWGSALPVSLPEGDKRALETKATVVSDLFVGATAGEPIISINVPVLQQGEIAFLLNAAIPATRFADILRSQALPEDWTGAIVDRTGRIIARTRQHDRFVGTSATADLRENAVGPEGTWIGTTAEGTPVLSAYSTTDLAGWRAAVGVPLATVEAPTRTALLWLGALGAVLLGGFALVAGWLGGRVAGAMRQLAGAAAALGRSEPVRPEPTVVREVNEIGEALTGAASELQRREDARRQAEEALREETERLDTLNRTGQAIAGELDVEALVQKVTDAGVQLTGAQFGAFFYNVVNERGESFTLYTISGVPRENFSRFPMPRNTHVFGPTFRGEGVVRSEDITKDPRYGKNEPHRGMPEGHLPVRSYMAVPVISRSGEVIGGLFFGHSEPGVFLDRHEALLTGITSQAAIAIDNARLFEAAQREIEQRRRAEESLRASEEQFRTLANSIPPLAWMAEGSGSRYWFSRRWYEFTGTTENDMRGWGWQKVHHPDHVERVTAHLKHAFESGEPWEDVFPLRRKDGEYRWFLARALPIRDEAGRAIRWFGTNTDITDQRAAEEALRTFNEKLEREVAERTRDLVEANTRLVAEVAQRERVEEQLRQSQKMEAIGQLTGGIAHDFNNLLAVISGSLEMLQRRLDKGELGALQRYVESAKEGAARAATLTHRLLAFSRQQPLSPEPVDANKLVAGMSDLLRRAIGEEVKIETVLAGGLWRAHADPNQLEHAILNLAVNGRDAMAGGGKLTIETANCHLDEAYTAMNAGASAGQYVLIAVTDTGKGMAPAVIARAFDPFFTTKSLGQGTGLGLSQVYGFARQTGGHVKIYSEPGQGTTVKLYLPRFVGAVAEQPSSSRGQSPLPMAANGETVLVVEDEDAVRRLSVEALRELGYRVLDAPSGAMALRALDGEAHVDLLFTDIVMPDMNGRKLADEALRRKPGLKVLFTTGYTRNAVVHNGVVDAGVHLIGKPFTIEQLASKVREVLTDAVSP